MTRTSRAFTLVELLVVMAIVGIVSVIGSVSFASTMRSVREKEGRDYLQIIENEINSFLLLNPSASFGGAVPNASTSQLFQQGGLRTGLEFYKSLPDIWIFGNAWSQNGRTIVLWPKDGVDAPAIVRIWNAASQEWQNWP